MRLSAIYIPKDSLPHIFGSNHDGQTLNLGGEYIYELIEDPNSVQLLDKTVNPSFIEGFWNENISLISSIVGRNGIGKTSILRAINIPPDPGHRNLIFIFEINGKTHVINETNKNFIADPECHQTNSRKFEVQYYSPVLDYDLKNTFSSISLIKYHSETIDNYHFDSVIRNVLLLNDPIIKSILEIYPDFPTYDKYYIRVRQNKKSSFTNTYVQANFGNPNRGDVLKNYLEGDLMRLENDESRETFKKKDVIDIYKQSIELLKSESFTEQFSKLWDLEDYKYQDNYDYVHGSDNFIKNFEITVLSYLLLGAVFPQTGLGGSYDFNQIINAPTFENRLNRFLEFYLVNIDEALYETIKESLNGIKISQAEQILALIEKHKIKSFQGIKYGPIKESLEKSVTQFSVVLQTYQYIVNLISDKKIKVNGGSLEFIIVEDDVKIYSEFIEVYKKFIDVFKNSIIPVSIVEFVPNKKLSTGEKSIIEFYSSLYTYITRIKDSRHLSHPYFLLLLDEPELGYHPIWKKKFIQAINKTLPILFSVIKPKAYDDSTKEYIKTDRDTPIIQIILCTHDPLTLSDLPNDKIIYLDKTYNDNSTFINNSNIQSFASNITDLLANSFFIVDGLIGDFAKEKIQEIIDILIEKSTLEDTKWLKTNEDLKKIIDLIGEPLLREKLAEMYFVKYPDSKTKEIELLRQKLKDLENGTDNS